MSFSQLLLVVLLAFITSCTEQGTVKSEDDLLGVKNLTSGDFISLRLLPEKAKIAAGRTLPFRVIGLLPYGREQDLTEQGEFLSSDSQLLTFSTEEKGQALALMPGQAKVQFLWQGKTLETNLEIGAVDCEQLLWAQKTTQFKLEKISGQFVAREWQAPLQALYSDGSIKDIATEATWVSSQPEIIKPLSPGFFALLQPGQVVITAEYLGRKESLELSVEEGEVTLKSLTLEPSGLVYPLNTAKELSLRANYSDQTTMLLRDQISLVLEDPSLVDLSLTSNGKIRIEAQTLGNTELKITTRGLSAQFVIQTVDPELQSLQIHSPKSFTLAKGEQETFRVFLIRSDASQEDVSSRVIWTAGNASVLGAVSGQLGRYLGLRVGTSTISASFAGLTATQNVNVGPASLSRIAISSLDSGTLGLYLTREYLVTATMSDGSTQNVTSLTSFSYSSAGGPGVGEFDSSQRNMFRALQSATVTIQASYQGQIITETLIIGGVVPIRLEIVQSWSTLSLAGGSQNLQAVLFYSNGSSENKTQDADWNYTIFGSGLSFAGIVRNDTGFKGICTPLAIGLFKVNASLNGFSAEKTIQVSP